MALMKRPVRLGMAFSLLVCMSFVFVMPAAAAQDTATVTCNGVSLTDNETAPVATISKGDQVTCTWTPDVGNASFFFMVGRGFSPLFGHATTTTFVAGSANAFASIVVYWSVPMFGSVTATFPYNIQ